MRAPGTVLVIAVALVAVACGGDAGTPVTESPAGDGAGAAATVAVASSDLGDLLVDGDGSVLYLFTPDEGGTPTCAGDCAANWPPVTGPAEPGDGLDPALLGSVTREDGAEQVTYGGWPLYRFAGDEAPGDTNGQGVNDVWFVVDASGNAVEDAPDGDDGAEAGGY